MSTISHLILTAAALQEQVARLTLQIGLLMQGKVDAPEAPAPTPEPAVEAAPPPAKKKKKVFGPRATRYASPHREPELVGRCLDLCSLGHSNWEIAAELRMSATVVSRIRSRASYVERLWPLIDAWRAQHPKAPLYNGIRIARGQKV